jgi:flagellar hook protein FlgE
MKTSPTSSAQSGLNAADAALAVSANNVANAGSTAFAPSRVVPEEAATGGVKVTISREAARGVGADYASEIAAQSRAVATYQANLKTVQAADETAAATIQLAQK